MAHIPECLRLLRQGSLAELLAEQDRLLARFEAEHACALAVYAACVERGGPDAWLTRTDFEILYDLLLGRCGGPVTVLLQTPGGSAEAARDMAVMLHEKFSPVRFLVTGQARSAGTLLALTGHELCMTRSGALGPVDAQVELGGSMVSAQAWLAWVEEARAGLAREGGDPLDAQALARVGPADLALARDALEYGREVLRQWLPRCRLLGADAGRAERILAALSDAGRWKSHRHSLGPADLAGLGLAVTVLEDAHPMADLALRIAAANQAVFSETPSRKVLLTASGRVCRQAGEPGSGQDAGGV